MLQAEADEVVRPTDADFVNMMTDAEQWLKDHGCLMIGAVGM